MKTIFKIAFYSTLLPHSETLSEKLIYEEVGFFQNHPNTDKNLSSIHFLYVTSHNDNDKTSVEAKFQPFAFLRAT